MMHVEIASETQKKNDDQRTRMFYNYLSVIVSIYVNIQGGCYIKGCEYYVAFFLTIRVFLAWDFTYFTSMHHTYVGSIVKE